MHSALYIFNIFQFEDTCSQCQTVSRSWIGVFLCCHLLLHQAEAFSYFSSNSVLVILTVSANSFSVALAFS